MRKTLVGIAALALAIAAAPLAGAKNDPSPRAEEKAQTTELQILGLNDFHGALEPPTGSAGRLGPAGTPEFGGVEYLATHVRALRATNPNTLFVSAGDLIGATPLVSALFHDEPTIEAFNLMGLDYNGVGNHEFDEGVDELLRMQNGGCHPVDGCFRTATASTARRSISSRRTCLQGQRRDDLPAVRDPPLQRRQGRHRRHDARGHAADRHAGGHRRTSTSSTRRTRSTRSCRELKKQNVETIIVLLHEGGNARTRRQRRGCRCRPDQQVRQLDGRDAADRRPHGRRDRRRRHRPHELGRQLRAWTARSSPARPRTAGRHGHRPDDRPRVEGRSWRRR